LDDHRLLAFNAESPKQICKLFETRMFESIYVELRQESALVHPQKSNTMMRIIVVIFKGHSDEI